MKRCHQPIDSHRSDDQREIPLLAASHGIMNIPIRTCNMHVTGNYMQVTCNMHLYYTLPQFHYTKNSQTV